MQLQVAEIAHFSCTDFYFSFKEWLYTGYWDLYVLTSDQNYPLKTLRFSQNEWGDPATSWKTTDNIFTDDEIRAFFKKRILGSLIQLVSCYRFQIVKVFVVDWWWYYCMILMLCNEMSQHLEDFDAQ